MRDAGRRAPLRRRASVTASSRPATARVNRNVSAHFPRRTRDCRLRPPRLGSRLSNVLERSLEHAEHQPGRPHRQSDPRSRSCARPRQRPRRSASCGSPCNTRRKNSDTASGRISPTTSASPCAARRARTARKYLKKGRPVAIDGRLSGASGRTRADRSASRSISSLTPCSSSAGATTLRQRERVLEQRPRDRRATFRSTPATSRPLRWRRSRRRRHPVLRPRSKQQIPARVIAVAKQRRRPVRRRDRKGGPTSGRRSPARTAATRSSRSTTRTSRSLRRFISERGKIRSRRITGACRRHQSQVARAVKRARELALLPYVAEGGERARRSRGDRDRDRDR